MTVTSPTPSVSRFAAFVLGLIVFVCVTMIGGAGYVKYRLDIAETMASAPESALGNKLEALNGVRDDLGYGGFLGLAQKYITSHDATVFPEMKERLKTASVKVSNLPAGTPEAVKKELIAMVSAFEAVQKKMDIPAGVEGAELDGDDLKPLYAVIPIIDARISAIGAESRLAAQKETQLWGMVLTLTSWASLIIAAACAAGVYLVLRDKHAAPMLALAQSVQNMARGDMRTAIWGVERQDAIGELARAVDMARYQFSHLPDLSLISEQGPVRMRFEGGTRSLFEAMMKSVTEDSSNIRVQASALTESVSKQNASVSQLTEKVETVLQNILQKGQTGDAQIKQAIADMVGSAEKLKNAHAHTADQLERLVPSLQDRAQGLADITHLAGKQLSSTLQSLTLSETAIKHNVEKTQETLDRLASASGDLGERMFAAMSLLQASGKVLSETVENLKNQGSMECRAAQLEDSFNILRSRIDNMQDSIGALRNVSEEEIAARISSLLSNASQPSSASSEQVAHTLDALGDSIREIKAGIADAKTSLYESASVQSKDVPADVIEKLEAMSSALVALKSEIALQKDHQSEIAAFFSTLPEQIKHELQGVSSSMNSDEGLKTLAIKIADLSAINDRVAVFAASLPGDLRQNLKEELQDAMGEIKQDIAAARSAVESTKATPACSFPPDARQQLLDQWCQISAQIEATRASVVEALAERMDQIETRLASRQPAASATKSVAEYSIQIQLEKQGEVLSALVDTLGLIDAHMQQIKSELHANDRA